MRIRYFWFVNKLPIAEPSEAEGSKNYGNYCYSKTNEGRWRAANQYVNRVQKGNVRRIN